MKLNPNTTLQPLIRYRGAQSVDKIVFTVEEIKNKIRKLCKLKAPGPDGFLLQ